MTDAKMVKNLRVVVMMEQVKGPKYTTVMKIKLCKKQTDTFCQSDWKKYNTDPLFRWKAIEAELKESYFKSWLFAYKLKPVLVWR